MSLTKNKIFGGFLLLLLAIFTAFLLPSQNDPIVNSPTFVPDTPTAAPVYISPTPTQPVFPNWLEVYFNQPASDEIERVLVSLIDNATHSVDITSFDFNLPSVLDALLRAHTRGVEVRVVLDEFSGATKLEASKSPTGQEIDAVRLLSNAGIEVVDGGRSNGLMHNKILIVDNKTLVTGSMNFSYNDTYRNDNNILVISDPTLIVNYQAKFDEMFDLERFGKKAQVGAQASVFALDGITVANYFSPRDGVMDKITTLVGSANHSVHFYAFVFTHANLANVLIERHNADVEVRGIFDSRSATQGAMASLYCANLPVKFDGTPYTMHHKVIIVDERIVITGSFNFTVSADTINDENLLIIADPEIAKLYLAEFERLDSLAKIPTPGQFACP